MTSIIEPATLFVILLGLSFVSVGILISILFHTPTVFSIGMIIVGIFLMFIPFTRERYQ